MRPLAQLLAAPGKEIAASELKIARAQSFAAYLTEMGGEVFAELLSIRRTDAGDEVVEFRVNVERPQHLAYDIRREESLVAVFSASDGSYPVLLALRADFPSAPHINLASEEFPRSLCLYDQPWENVRLNWTPAQFLSRARYWLAQTARGTLHAADQPLEPLIQGSHATLVLPSDFIASSTSAPARLLDVCAPNGLGPNDSTLVAVWQDGPKKSNAIRATAVVLELPKQQHGIIRRQPANLKELHELAMAAGYDLVKELGAKIQSWHATKPHPDILKAGLIIILSMPKSRRADAAVESTEIRAFLTVISVAEVGAALDVIQVHEGKSGYVIGGPSPKPENFAKIRVALLQVVHDLSAEQAAAMNGIDGFQPKVMAIGMGALGSQIFNNLLRSGFGKWTLVDPDNFLPHNGARHVLGSWVVGQNKAHAMLELGNAVLDDTPAVAAIPADVLNPGEQSEALSKAYEAAEVIFDFSASVSVTRHLSEGDSNARHIGAFLNPRGDCLIVTAEDRQRDFRLDWLEMLHYRAVLTEKGLSDSLQAPDGRLRYGNSCRDVSTRLAQDDAALAAATASKAIKRLVKEDHASVSIFKNEPDGSVKVYLPSLSALFSEKLGKWTIRFDHILLKKLISLRKSKLPNETGGVLLGHFDTHSLVCSIIDVIASPSDSVEWPTTYIRGSNGLAETVRKVEEQTLGQIGYVGEWHSHPRGASISPSEDDRKAYSWLVGHMNAETLPAIMLIVGDGSKFCLVNTDG